ncbi:hypothetical protein CPB86DRAFT_749134, partial [Serendipita vermifera]
MSTLTLTDITLELSSLHAKFLKDVPHLTLEFGMNGSAIAKVKLSWCEVSETSATEVNHRPLGNDSVKGPSARSRVFSKGTTVKGKRIWSTNEKPSMNGLVGELEISAWIELGKDESELIGCTTLNGEILFESIGKQFEAQLVCPGTHLCSVLKAQVMHTDNNGDPTSTIGPQSTPPLGDHSVDKIRLNSIAALKDFKRNGNVASLEKAISQLETAVQVIPQDNPKLPALINLLGSCLTRRFERLGQLTDLNNAVERLRVAVDLTPSHHPNKPGRLNNLALSLKIRCERLGDANDLDDSILCQQEVVGLTQDGHPDKPTHLSSLGKSLRIRFERLGNMNDLDDAILRQQEAINLIPKDDPDKPGRLNNLGNSLRVRFERLGNIDDLDNAISRQQETVNMTADDHPDKPHRLNNLGNSLRTRFQRSGDIIDIDNAISSQQEA